MLIVINPIKVLVLYGFSKELFISPKISYEDGTGDKNDSSERFYELAFSINPQIFFFTFQTNGKFSKWHFEILFDSF